MAKMLSSGGLDYYVGLSMNARWVQLKNPMDSPFKTIKIAGAAGFSERYVACSDQTVGRQVIRKLDKLLADDRNWASFLAPLKDWFEPADFTAALEKRPELQ
jgi:hypothetical protein